ncbi:MAG TPA: thiamine-phosphate kinase [Gammaproteobacteria bacterium]|nr:thiamine-phosphate kinase [Gammaproteobacteria bacterium]
MRDLIPSVAQDVKLSIGDDGSVVEIDQEMELVTVLDTITVGTHYLPSASSNSIGHRIFVVNLSDIAAMGAKPKWAHLSLSLPKLDKLWIEGFIAGISPLLLEHDLNLIGGDTIRGPEMISLSIQGVVKKDRYVTRVNANDGDLIYVTGHLGSAAFGLHLLKSGKDEPKQFIHDFNFPTPRVNEGIFLSDFASSMIDVSDGFEVDLLKLTKGSNLGFEVNIDQLPIKKEMLDCIGFDQSISMALSGGDDYELCFTIPSEMRNEFERKWHDRFKTKISIVGMIIESSNNYKYNNQDYMVENKNFEHF